MGPLKFEFRRPSLTASGEVGSLAELVGILQDEGSSLVKMFGDDMELVVQSVSQEGQAPETTGDVTTTTEPAKRGRKKNQPDPAAAQAPPPAPIPGAAAPPAPAAPVNTAENANGLPAFLDRTTAAAPPPPPLLPAAPPAAPPVAPAAPPVSGPVGAKIIEIITAKTAGAADGGQSYADWLATAGVTIKGATLAEALSVLRMTTDEKLAGVATALGVTA